LRSKSRPTFRAAGKIQKRFKEEGDIAFANASEKTAEGEKLFQTSRDTICSLFSAFNGRVNKKFIGLYLKVPPGIDSCVFLKKRSFASVY